ncbi:MAG: Hsp20/alpha crystallin family protein [Candidatus Sericytochromatia bacterium]|nr:Hsp20/alpha crystallin family protein [Candidatus Sericytochromatia bacterium]
MALRPWFPQGEIDTLRQQMNRMVRDTERLFATFIPGLPSKATTEEGMAWIPAPACDLTVGEDESVLVLEVPGIEARNLTIEAHDEGITVTGTQTVERTIEGETMVHERAAGKFQRQVALPCVIDPEKTSAQLKHGLLTIKMPHKEGSRPKGRHVPIAA